MSEVIKLKHPSAELSEQDYQLWKRHPVSQIFFQWARDKAKDYRDTAIMAWELDQMSLALDGELKYRVKTLEELDKLNLSDIKSFYDSLGMKTKE